MKFSFVNILNLLETKQGNFDTKQSRKMDAVGVLEDLNLSAVFFTILSQFLSKSTNMSLEGHRYNLFEETSSINASEMVIEISQEGELKETVDEIKNNLPGFLTLMQKVSTEQENHFLPDLNLDSDKSEDHDHGRISAEFTLNVKEQIVKPRLNLIPRREQKILSEDAGDKVKTGMKVGVEKIIDPNVGLVIRRDIFMRDLKGYPVISSGAKSQNQKQEEKPLGKVVATFDKNGNLIQMVGDKISFHKFVGSKAEIGNESPVKIEGNNFKTEKKDPVSDDRVQKGDEVQNVKFDELMYRTSGRISDARNGLSVYSAKVELASQLRKFEVSEDVARGEVITKGNVKVQDVVDVVKNLISTGENSKNVELTLKLEPKELGEVVVKISRGEKGFSILFEVKNVEVKQTIESSISNLKLMLETSNVDLEKVGVVFSNLGLNPENSKRDHGWRKFARRKEFDLDRSTKIYGGSLIEAII